MPLFRQHGDSSQGWGIWKCDETFDETVGLLHDDGLLHEAQERFSHVGKQHEWLAVRLLIALLLGRDKRVAYYESGRPYLTDNSYYISISHTKGYVAVAYNLNGMVGVDIEQTGDRVKRLKERFMNDMELQTVPPDEEQNYLLLHWSAKETVYKILDLPSLDFRRQLTIVPFRLQSEGAFQMKETATVGQSSFVVRYFLHSDFVFTFCGGEQALSNH